MYSSDMNDDFKGLMEMFLVQGRFKRLEALLWYSPGIKSCVQRCPSGDCFRFVSGAALHTRMYP